MNVEQTMEVLKAANPVPDEGALAPPRETSADYLAGLEQRSDDEMRLVEELETDTVKTPSNRGRVMAMAVAAVVLAAAIGYGLVSLIGPGNDVIDDETDADLTDLPTVLLGSWESSYGDFTFTDFGTYNVDRDGALIEYGTYRIIGTLVTLTAEADSAECAGATDTLSVTADSADQLTVRWEAVGCEAHFSLDCFLPGGGGEGCGRMDRSSGP